MSDKKKTSYSALKGFHRAVPIILAAVAVFICLCFVTQDTGKLGPAISNVLLGLFSWGAYFIPALIGLHALFYPADVGAKRVVSRIIFSTVAVMFVSAFAHTVKYWGNKDIVLNLGEFYKNGTAAVGGGAIGGLIGYGIIALIGSVGAVILAASVIAIYLTYFFSSGKNIIKRIFFGMLKGIVYFCAWVEKGIKRLFRLDKKEKKAAKDAEEKNRALMDDDFFDVDNGIEHLEISELGISETRDRASVEEHATLRDKVHHKSDATPEAAAEAERKAKERVARNASYYDEGEDKPEGKDKGFVIDADLYEDRHAPKGTVSTKAEPNADDIFTAEFDPYELATSEKLANKPSSRSLLDEKPTVTENIPEMSEAELERARRNAEFERRKAALVAAEAARSEAARSEATKSVAYTTDTHTTAPSVTETASGTSVVIEKHETAPAPAKPETPTYTYTAEPHTATPVAPYTGAATAEVRSEATVTDGGAKATYRRAAEFATATVEEQVVAHKPTGSYAEPVHTHAEPTPVVRPAATYAEPTPTYTESAPAYTETKPATAYAEPTYTEARPAATYAEPVTEIKTEPAAAYSEPIPTVSEPVAYTVPRESKPTSTSFSFDDDDEDVYTPSFGEGGEYSTDGKDAEDGEPAFKDYGGAESAGLVFEFDMGKEPETPVLVTETTHYGDVEDGEDDEVIDEVVEEDCTNEEIPPEKQNPAVAEMRDMFPALRETPVAKTVVADEEDEDFEDEDIEDEPPFDAPTVVVTPPPAKAEKPKAKPSYKNYKKPPLELMELEEVEESAAAEIANEIKENTNIIIETLQSFNVTASIKGVDRGPRITRYEVVPAKGVKVNQITNLLDNITMNLAAEGIRMEAPIPGKSAIGFEIPNKHPQNVRLRELLECEEFINSKSNTFVCIGKDVAGHPVFGDIAKFPHALVAGATGMGKSVCINSIMISLLYKSRPDQIKFIMIDPKKVEFRMYSGIPHLLIPVITDAKQAAGALMWAVDEMERRYDVIEKLNIRNVEAYNEKQALDPSIGEHMPKIVIVIDELNDLMMQVRDPVEGLIMRIAQKARAADIHLIIVTQRPDVKVITGTIKANINTRLSCKVTSVVDSRTILEMAGAEKLLNRGDMLFKPVDKTKPIRVQGAYVSDSEVEAIMEFLKSQGEGAQYDEEIFAEVNKAAQKCGNKKGGGGADPDDDGDGEDTTGYYNDQKFLDAVELAIRSGKISTSLLQRKMSIGYGKAAKYIDAMEEIGVVGEANGQKPREVLMTMDQWYERLSRVDIG